MMSDEFSVTLTEAHNLCVRRGLPLTKETIVHAGLKWGWGKRLAPRTWGFKKKELTDWISAHGEKPEPGWVLVSQASKETGVPIETLYTWTQSEKVRSKIIGAGNGRRHVCLEDVKKCQKTKA